MYRILLCLYFFFWCLILLAECMQVLCNTITQQYVYNVHYIQINFLYLNILQDFHQPLAEPNRRSFGASNDQEATFLELI